MSTGLPRMILIGGTEAEQQLKSLEEYARDPAHWYRPTQSIPAESEPYVRRIKVRDAGGGPDIGFRVLFTYSVSDCGRHLFRHASITLIPRDLPDRLSTLTICKFLGYHGTPDDWCCEEHPKVPGVLTVMQRAETYHSTRAEQK